MITENAIKPRTQLFDDKTSKNKKSPRLGSFDLYINDLTYLREPVAQSLYNLY